MSIVRLDTWVSLEDVEVGVVRGVGGRGGVWEGGEGWGG